MDSRFAKEVDHNGQTLIPPTLQEFAETFQSDLRSVLELNLHLSHGNSRKPNTIFVTVGNDSSFADETGRWTSEAYKLEVDDRGLIQS